MNQQKQYTIEDLTVVATKRNVRGLSGAIFLEVYDPSGKKLFEIQATEDLVGKSIFSDMVLASKDPEKFDKLYKKFHEHTHLNLKIVDELRARGIDVDSSKLASLNKTVRRAAYSLASAELSDWRDSVPKPGEAKTKFVPKKSHEGLSKEDSKLYSQIEDAEIITNELFFGSDGTSVSYTLVEKKKFGGIYDFVASDSMAGYKRDEEKIRACFQFILEGGNSFEAMKMIDDILVEISRWSIFFGVKQHYPVEYEELDYAAEKRSPGLEPAMEAKDYLVHLLKKLKEHIKTNYTVLPYLGGLKGHKSGKQVEEFQQFFNLEFADKVGIPPIAVDGLWGDQTIDAVTKMKNWLLENGYYDSHLLKVAGKRFEDMGEQEKAKYFKAIGSGKNVTLNEATTFAIESYLSESKMVGQIASSDEYSGRIVEVFSKGLKVAGLGTERAESLLARINEMVETTQDKDEKRRLNAVAAVLEKQLGKKSQDSGSPA